MKRYHLTSRKQLNLSLDYQQKPGNLKPNGIWYSLGDEWLQWVKSEMPSWREKYNIEIIMSEKNLLIIDSIQRLEAFQAQYSMGREERTTLNFMMIDWESVAKKYSGIEIRDYHAIQWEYSKREKSIHDGLWLSAWDVSSGCIWDLDKISGYTVNETPLLKDI